MSTQFPGSLPPYFDLTPDPEPPPYEEPERWKVILSWVGAVLGGLLLLTGIFDLEIDTALLGFSFLLPGAWFLLHERREKNGSMPLQRHWVIITVISVISFFTGAELAPDPEAETTNPASSSTAPQPPKTTSKATSSSKRPAKPSHTSETKSDTTSTAADKTKDIKPLENELMPSYPLRMTEEEAEEQGLRVDAIDIGEHVVDGVNHRRAVLDRDNWHTVAVCDTSEDGRVKVGVIKRDEFKAISRARQGEIIVDGGLQFLLKCPQTE